MYMLMTIHIHLHKTKWNMIKNKECRYKVKRWKIEKVISILENALISDFILKSANAAVLFVYLCSCFVPGVSAYIQLYTFCVNALCYAHREYSADNLWPRLWPFKDFASAFACVFSSRVAGEIGEPVLTTVAWC